MRGLAGPALPAPSGPYAVGRLSLDLVDSARVDGTSPTQRRQLMVYVWYPAAATGGRAEAPYVPGFARLQQVIGDSAMHGEFRAAFDRVASGQVSSGAFSGAPPAKSTERFPILLFSHGFGESSLTYAAILGDLASHGYVIVAIEHPHDAYAVLHSDGHVTPFAQAAWDAAVARPRGAVTYQVAQVTRRAEDIRFVLQRLERDTSIAVRAILQVANPNRVGAFGHSLGGMAAAEACRTDARFIACMNIDADIRGVPWIEASRGAPRQTFAFLATPHSLYMTPRTRAPSAATLAQEGLTATQHDSLMHALQRSQDDALASVGSGAYRVDFEGSGFDHRSFLDLPLLGAASESAARQHAANLGLARRYILAFFEATLRRRSTTRLEASATDSAGVRVERWPPHSPR